jgi:hypothetical protein
MRNIENRLRKMESRLNTEPSVCTGLAMVRHGLPRERTKNLAMGERVVVDWFREIGGTLWGRERISSDPADQGRVCKKGGYLLDVIQEVHGGCRFREHIGACQTCEGTPVAEGRPQQPLSE